MRSKRAIMLACAVALLTMVTSAGSIAASTEVSHVNVIGPGVQAFWAGGQDAAGNDTTTNLLVFQQLNAPGSRGFFREVVVIRDGYGAEGWLYEAIYDTFVGSEPTVLIKQPLAYAAVRGSAPLVSCDGTCDATLPDEVTFDETWTGTGAITRAAAFQQFELSPGVKLDKVHETNFFRAATLGAPDPFDGALGALGTLTTSDPGVRFFDVHLAMVTVCHPDGCPD